MTKKDSENVSVITKDREPNPVYKSNEISRTIENSLLNIKEASWLS